MIDASGIALSLKWRKTWDDKENDFVAEAPGLSGSVGRIFMMDGGSSDLRGQWYWTMNAMLDRVVFSDSGHEPTAREAAREVEAVWFERGEPALMKQTGQKPSANAYALAKGRV